MSHLIFFKKHRSQATLTWSAGLSCVVGIAILNLFVYCFGILPPSSILADC